MGTKSTRGIPAPLKSVRQRFDNWRRTRKVRSPIPDELWDSAVKMAGMHGLHRTAKTLRVNYYTLKKRVEQEAAGDSRALEDDPVTTFVELTPPAPAASCECTLELEDSGGVKMRVYLKGVDTIDLTALTRSFWRTES